MDKRWTKGGHLNYKNSIKSLIKPSKAANILGVSTKTIQRWYNNGELEGVRTSDKNNSRYIFLDSVLKKKILLGMKLSNEYCKILNYLF